MVSKYGMSDVVGAIMFGAGQEEVFLGRDLTQSKNYSEQTAAIIDAETKNIIDKAYKRAEEILKEHEGVHSSTICKNAGGGRNKRKKLLEYPSKWV